MGFRPAAAEAAPSPSLDFSPLLNVKATKAVKGVSVERRALTNDNCLKGVPITVAWAQFIPSWCSYLGESVRKRLNTAAKATGMLSPQRTSHLKILWSSPRTPPQQLDCVHYVSPGKYARIQPPRPNRGVPGQLPGVTWSPKWQREGVGTDPCYLLSWSESSHPAHSYLNLEFGAPSRQGGVHLKNSMAKGTTPYFPSSWKASSLGSLRPLTAWVLV